MTHNPFISTIYEKINKLRKASAEPRNSIGGSPRHADRSNDDAHRERSMVLTRTEVFQPGVYWLDNADMFFSDGAYCFCRV